MSRKVEGWSSKGERKNRTHVRSVDGIGQCGGFPTMTPDLLDSSPLLHPRDAFHAQRVRPSTICSHALSAGPILSAGPVSRTKTLWLGICTIAPRKAVLACFPPDMEA